jgi:hypothetical protein
MSSAPNEQAAIYVEENHTYDVDLGRQPIIQWVPDQGFISVRVQIPYDGQLRYLGEQQLKDVRTSEAHLPLGQIMVVFPENTQATTTIPISLPAGSELSVHLKSGKRMRLHRRVPIAQFNDTLIAVDGQIFDGADLDPGHLRKLIFEHTDAFVRDLRLQLALWVPDLVARTAQSKERGLREMLLQRESARQIFLSSIGNIDRLAESLAALANGSGGRVLIGVDQYGQVLGLPTQEDPSYREQLKQALLVAALRSTPAVSIAPPDYLQAPDGKTVARVIVPAGAAGPHQIDGQAFYREGAVTLSRPAQASRAPAMSAGAIVDITDVLKAGDSDDVIILDAGNGPLNALELGPMISALINSGKRDGLILVRNLGAATSQPASLLPGHGAGALRQFEEHLEQELKQCIPHLLLRPALAQINHEQIAVLPVSSELAPVALYDGIGYDWNNRARRSLNTDEVFERYLRRQGMSGTDRSGGDPIWMVHGEISWPIQPPQSLTGARDRTATGDGRCMYDVQRQAMVWKASSFEPQHGTAGRRCELTTPLGYALMDVDETGVGVAALPELRGHIQVRLNDVLASGVEIVPQSDSDLLRNLPVYKRTHLWLRIKANPQELFRRRRRMSLLRFRLLDVALDIERVGDLKQACADLGFRLSQVDQSELPDRAMMEGVRSEGFCDIGLLVGLVCDRTLLTRALHYEQRTDSRTSDATLLDIRILLWGSGDDAAAEIARLHMALHQIIQQRLAYLHTE